jgi:hypothetical protein
MAFRIEYQPSLFDHPELHAAVETMADAGAQEPATIRASPRTAADADEFADLAELTGLKTFITSFAGHIAAEAARR